MDIPWKIEFKAAKTNGVYKSYQHLRNTYLIIVLNMVIIVEMT